ncbi:MAG: hypothetical protein ACLS7Y_01575 [Thomasclavelia spiroformis]
MFKRVIVLVFGVVVVACSSALTLKAAIGVGAWDALAQTGSLVTGIEVGTIGMFCNFYVSLFKWQYLEENLSRSSYYKFLFASY